MTNLYMKKKTEMEKNEMEKSATMQNNLRSK